MNKAQRSDAEVERNFLDDAPVYPGSDRGVHTLSLDVHLTTLLYGGGPRAGRIARISSGSCHRVWPRPVGRSCRNRRYILSSASALLLASGFCTAQQDAAMHP